MVCDHERMNRLRTALTVTALMVVALSGTLTLDRSASGAALPSGTAIGGTTCKAFPDSNWWHADIRSLPVHPYSAKWLARMSTSSRLHPDFGPSYGDGPNYGIPITVVDSAHPDVTVKFDYASESDRLLKYPFGDDT